jgi:hypothetical protein
LQTLFAVVAPASNGGVAYVYANATAPTSLFDATCRIIFTTASITGGTGFANMVNPIFIRTGLGLYVICNFTANIAVSYDLVG